MVWNGLITFLNLIPRTTIDFIGLLYVSKAQVILFVIHSDYYTSSKDVQQQAIENGHHLVSHLHFQPTAVWSRVCHFPLLSFNSPTQRGRLRMASVSSEELLALPVLDMSPLLLGWRVLLLLWTISSPILSPNRAGLSSVLRLSTRFCLCLLPAAVINSDRKKLGEGKVYFVLKSVVHDWGKPKQGPGSRS